MKTKITLTVFSVLIMTICFLLYRNNKLLQNELKEKKQIIVNMEQQHKNNALDMEKINQENKKYQETNKKLSNDIRNIQSDCLHTCKIPEELKNILNQ